MSSQTVPRPSEIQPGGRPPTHPDAHLQLLSPAGWSPSSLTWLLASLTLVFALAVHGIMIGLLATTSLWNDELYSIINFASRGPWVVATDYHAPNNHILFNLLNIPFVNWDPRSPLIVRFISMVATLTGLLLSSRLALRYGPIPAVLIVAIFSLSPNALELFYTARGYGLSFLCSVLLLIGAERFLRRQDRASLWLVGLASLSGIYTIPVFALLTSGVYLALLLFAPRRRLALLISGAVAAGIVILLYLPVLDEMRAAAVRYEGRWGADFDDWTAVAQLVLRYGMPPLRILQNPEHRQAFSFLFFFALFIIVAIGARWMDPSLSRMAAFTLTAAGLAFLSAHILRTPAFRTMAMVWYFVALGLGIISVGVARRCLTPWARWVCSSGAMILCCILLSHAIRDAVSRQPIESWKEVAQKLDALLPPGEAVICPFRGHFLQFYTDRAVRSDAPKEFCRDDDLRVFVDADFFQRSPDVRIPCARGHLWVRQQRGRYQRIFLREVSAPIWSGKASQVVHIPLPDGERAYSLAVRCPSGSCPRGRWSGVSKGGRTHSLRVYDDGLSLLAVPIPRAETHAVEFHCEEDCDQPIAVEPIMRLSLSD